MNSVKFRLEPHHEFYAPIEDVPQNVRDALSFPPLVHQLETYKQLKENHIVFNSFATGTGKTLAAYLHLLDRPTCDALIIAPTNALITQHAQDLEEFKKRSKIPHHIIEIDAAKLRSLKESAGITRNQDAFFKVLSNPYEFADALNLDVATKSERAPLVLVTNPDLFYYALYGLVNPIDRRNLTMAMFTFFDYIVIDEFHYYDAKQFCAFLFFTVMSHSLGFLEDAKTERRLAILTATPNDDIKTFFKRLRDNHGLKYSMVSPENDYPQGDAVQTLAAMDVELSPFASRQSANLPENMGSERLRGWLEQDMTGAVISDRLADVSVLSHKLRGQFDFEKVTGAVAKHDRPTILKTPLLLATPTVDIGYNFRREDKDRQNIDFLVFIAEYYDEFWQRIGRAGRVLGKVEQNFVSHVQALIPEPLSEEAWLEFSQLNGKTLTHQNLKQITEELLASKPFNSAFIASQGLNATLSSFGVMLQSLPADDIYLLEEALKLVQEVFAPKFSPKTTRQVWGYISENVELNQTVSENSLPKRKLLEKFLIFRDGQATEETVRKLKGLLKNHQEARDIFNDYLKARRAVFQAQTSFRGSGDEVRVQVYDPQRFLTNTETTTHYDLMHLLRYFQLEVYKSAEQFVQDSNQLSSEDLQVKLSGLLEARERPFISFRLETTECPEKFDTRYVHKLWAFQGLDIILNDGARQIDPKAQQALKNTFLPVTLFDSSDKKFIYKFLRDFKLFPRDIEVAFVKYGESQPYIGIVGEMGEQALKILERNKRWNRHISSLVIV